MGTPLHIITTKLCLQKRTLFLSGNLKAHFFQIVAAASFGGANTLVIYTNNGRFIHLEKSKTAHIGRLILNVIAAGLHYKHL